MAPGIWQPYACLGFFFFSFFLFFSGVETSTAMGPSDRVNVKPAPYPRDLHAKGLHLKVVTICPAKCSVKLFGDLQGESCGLVFLRPCSACRQRYKCRTHLWAVGHLLEATTCLHKLNLELLRLLFILIVTKWFQMLFPAVVSTDFCSVRWIAVVFTVVFELSVKLNLFPLLWVSFRVYGEPVLSVPKNKI